jgi:glycosyltransferase involved in cell wall biosynthesis
MSAEPLVSVIVPTYQRAALLDEALRSALSQTYDRLEVLVEDDGSSDGSEAIVARLGDPRVRYAWEPNVGRPAPVRNRGIGKSRGELLAFLDSDDVWEKEKLAREVDVLRREPQLLAVSCNARWIPPRDRLVLRTKEDLLPSFDDLLGENVVLCSGTVVRRAAIETAGVFDEALAVIEDYDLWLRVLRHRDSSIRVLAAPLFRYRASPDAISPFGRQELDAMRRVFAKHDDFHPDAVRNALALRERNVRRAELRDALRAGTLPLSDWLRAPDLPLRRRVRLAAKAILLGRGRV